MNDVEFMELRGIARMVGRKFNREEYRRMRARHHKRKAGETPMLSVTLSYPELQRIRKAMSFKRRE